VDILVESFGCSSWRTSLLVLVLETKLGMREDAMRALQCVRLLRISLVSNPSAKESNCENRMN
jgi:hypothetical protein